MRKTKTLLLATTLTIAVTLIGCWTGPGGCGGEPPDVTFETGQVDAPDATIIVNGEEYSEQAAVGENALVGIVKDGQAYLYHPAMGNAELSDENSRRAVGYFIVGLSAESSSDKRTRIARLAIGESTRIGTGIDVTRTEQTTYRFTNAKNRWVAVKSPVEPSHVLLPPRSTWVDTISLGGLLSLIPGVTIGPNESRDVAVDTRQVETYGAITRVFPLLYIPGPFGDGVRSKAQAAMDQDMELFRTVCYVEFVHIVVEAMQALTPDPSECIEGLAVNAALDAFNTFFIGFVGGDQVAAQQFSEALLADFGQSAILCACTASGAAGNPAAPVCATAGVLLDILAFFNWIIDDNIVGTWHVWRNDAYATVEGIENDNCPDDPNKTEPGACGCGTPDTDSDGDGTPDCNDGCPYDTNKTSPGNCECGNPETPDCGAGDPPNCIVFPSLLDYGQIDTGSHSDLTFEIENTGGGTLQGNVSESCSHFSIVSGGGSYSLGAGQTREVTVRFAPTSSGQKECLIDTGHVDCNSVVCRGVGGDIPPECNIYWAPAGGPSTANFNDFGTRAIGSNTLGVFTIENVGGGTLTGSVSESCAHYWIATGGGSFSLEPNETHPVGVFFTPTSPGTHTCTINLGTTCGSTNATGVGQ